jgi:hypothetical protein
MSEIKKPRYELTDPDEEMNSYVRIGGPGDTLPAGLGIEVQAQHPVSLDEILLYLHPTLEGTVDGRPNYGLIVESTDPSLELPVGGPVTVSVAGNVIKRDQEFTLNAWDASSSEPHLQEQFVFRALKIFANMRNINRPEQQPAVSDNSNRIRQSA